MPVYATVPGTGPDGVAYPEGADLERYRATHREWFRQIIASSGAVEAPERTFTTPVAVAAEPRQVGALLQRKSDLQGES